MRYIITIDFIRIENFTMLIMVLKYLCFELSYRNIPYVIDDTIHMISMSDGHDLHEFLIGIFWYRYNDDFGLDKYHWSIICIFFIVGDLHCFNHNGVQRQRIRYYGIQSTYEILMLNPWSYMLAVCQCR